MILPFLVALALLPPQKGREEVQVTSRLEPGVVKLGDRAVLRVVVSGTEEASLDPPPVVKGLQIVSTGRPAPSVREFHDLLRGIRERSVTLTFAFAVVPGAEGVYEIPPLRGRAAGKPFETRAHRLEVVRDFTGASLAFLEVAGPKRRVFRGEIFRIEATFGIRSDVVESGTASSPTLRAPWAEEIQDAVRLPSSEVDRTVAQQVALNGRNALVERAGRLRRGPAEFVAWRLSVPYVASFPGSLSVGSSFFAFDQVTRWGRDFFGERVPADRETMFVGATAFEIAVEPLPEEGRPEGFSGAIGTFRILADANPRDVKAGESIRLALTISGGGNLEFFDPPDLERMKGFERFRFFGKVEEKGATKREIVFDLAPTREEVESIPSIPFSFFDPEEGAYRTVHTEPIPIRVRPIPPGEGLADLPGRSSAVEAAADDLRDAKPVLSHSGPSPRQGTTFGVAAAAPPFLYCAALLARARRRRRDADPLGWRRRRAAAEFRRRASILRSRFEGGDARGACADLSAAIAHYLADRLGTSGPAVIGSDVLARMRGAREPEDLARAFAEILEACDRAVFAGSGGAAGGSALLERAQDLVRRLEKEGNRR